MAYVTLRPLQNSDAAVHFAHKPHPEIVAMYGGDPDNPPKPSLARSENWLAWMQDHQFARMILADGRPVGAIRLHHFDETKKSAKLALGLFAIDDLNKGIGRHAIRLTLDIAFNDFHLAHVDLSVLAVNKRAIRCYEACGFQWIKTETIIIRKKAQDEWTMRYTPTSSE